MRASTSDTVPAGAWGAAMRLLRGLAVATLVVLAVLVFRAAPAGAQDATDPGGDNRSLYVDVSFPDGGVLDGEQVCLALYPGDAADFSAPPIQSQCLAAGEESATFEGLGHGAFQVIVPAPGSTVGDERYQGQRIETDIPDSPDVNAFDIPVELSLRPELAGVTGQIEVNVFGCPPGTDGGGDATLWQSECNAVADGVPISLSGLGTIEHTEIAAITGQQGIESGRAQFTNLPIGDYQFGGDLPENVADTPALFVESSIDGSIGPIQPDEPLSVRPGEGLALNVYLVLEEDAPVVDAAPTGADLDVRGGLTSDEATALAERNAEDE